MWDNGGWNVILDQIEFIDICSVSRDLTCNVAAWGIRKALTVCFVTWLKQGPKDGPP